MFILPAVASPLTTSAQSPGLPDSERAARNGALGRVPDYPGERVNRPVPDVHWHTAADDPARGLQGVRLTSSKGAPAMYHGTHGITPQGCHTYICRTDPEKAAAMRAGRYGNGRQNVKLRRPAVSGRRSGPIRPGRVDAPSVDAIPGDPGYKYPSRPDPLPNLENERTLERSRTPKPRKRLSGAERRKRKLVRKLADTAQ